ncbi:HAD hydrolase-like protein [Kiloniella antarctica]|uniref:HAD hydrolase-like protein n=1 Tax=Kiloniella antarctica TaxID=1550907 RepID=A0ABW5BPX6_9PROT
MMAIFFDLDGTLSDPKEGITKSIEYALKAMDVTVPEVDDLLWCIGPPLRKSFEFLLAGEERVEEAMFLYRERFADVGLYENNLYSEIPALLTELEAKGLDLYVATSKPYVYAKEIIQHFGLAPYFKDIYGSELDGTRGDKGELLKYALFEAGCDAQSSVMVGDREHDAIGALKNKMTSIGVLYGYGSKEELERAGVHYLVESPSDITMLVCR